MKIFIDQISDIVKDVFEELGYDREYSNHLDAGEVFEKSFSILFY